MNTYVVIMAGGSGERFWPLSRIRKPKQLLGLTNPNVSMLAEAIARIEPLVPAERILIITSEVLQGPIRDAIPTLPKENVVAEPAKRNTAPCLALACSLIQKREGADALMAVLTADHFIGNAADFRNDVEKALQYAEQHNALVTIGIPPTRPETGYGYIQVQEQQTKGDVIPVEGFKEKPPFSVAVEYVKSGRYLWNSGMFFWRTGSLQAAMDALLPDVSKHILPMTNMLSEDCRAELSETFALMPDISIDYGVMERAANVAVLPASFPWDDVGSWDALERMQPLDQEGNVRQGDTVCLETSGSIVVNAHHGSHIVATLGIEDCVVVVTDDATLVCSKSRAQDVKAVVAQLRNENRRELL